MELKYSPSWKPFLHSNTTKTWLVVNFLNISKSCNDRSFVELQSPHYPQLWTSAQIACSYQWNYFFNVEKHMRAPAGASAEGWKRLVNMENLIHTFMLLCPLTALKNFVQFSLPWSEYLTLTSIGVWQFAFHRRSQKVWSVSGTPVALPSFGNPLAMHNLRHRLAPCRIRICGSM